MKIKNMAFFLLVGMLAFLTTAMAQKVIDEAVAAGRVRAHEDDE